MLGMPYIRALEVANVLYPVFSSSPLARGGACPGVRYNTLHAARVGRPDARLQIPDFPGAIPDKMLTEHFPGRKSNAWVPVANAPMVMIFKDTYEDLSPERLEEIIDAFASGKGASVKPGPQNGRECSEPLSGLTCLTDEKILLKRNRGKADGKAAAAKKDAATKTAKSASRAAAKKPTSAKAVEAGVGQAIVARQEPTRCNGTSGISGQSADRFPVLAPRSRAFSMIWGFFTFKQVSGWKKAEREMGRRISEVQRQNRA